MQIEIKPDDIDRLVKEALLKSAFGDSLKSAMSQMHHLETGRREIRPAQRRLISAYLSGYRPADWPTQE